MYEITLARQISQLFYLKKKKIEIFSTYQTHCWTLLVDILNTLVLRDFPQDYKCPFLMKPPYIEYTIYLLVFVAGTVRLM